MGIRVNVINIGCFKNLVDCEKLLYQLNRIGVGAIFGRTDAKSDIVIINTCGFTGDAEEDSLKEIQNYAEKKRKGQIGQLWIMGCYSQKKGESLKKLVPEVDCIYGNFDWENIIINFNSEYEKTEKRILTTPSHYAYLKISDGCSMPCSYCIKPQLNGPFHSFEMKDLLEECNFLVSKGVKEFQIVAQNLTSYGSDLYGKKTIAELVERISDIKGVEWIRLHYAYPHNFPMELLKVIRERENVCNYLDMAIQHCSSRMLKLMRRGQTKEELTDLIHTIRESVPGIYIRTTVMIGHPGETEDDYNELYEYIEKMRFERLGVFPYSHQKGSYSDKHYTDDVPEKVKRNRALCIMSLQKKIYNELNSSLIGKQEKVIIDEINNNYIIARDEHSTPMADPKIILPLKADVYTGQFHNIKIIDSLGKDMKGLFI